MPGILSSMGLDEFLVQLLLDLLTMLRRKVRNSHVDVAGQGVQTGSNHGKADRLELVIS